MFTLNEDTLLKIAAGKMNPITAFTLQKLKVEGDFDKALKLQDFIQGKSARYCSDEAGNFLLFNAYIC